MLSHSPRTLLGRLPTFLRRYRSKPRIATERETQPRSRPLIWTRNLVSGMLRRRNQLREPPILVFDVPCTTGKPVPFFHSHLFFITNFCIAELSRKKEDSCQLLSTYVIPAGRLQSTASASQQPLPTATAPKELPTVVATAVATDTSSHPDIIISQAGCWTQFLFWTGCVSFQYTDSQH
ncbi:hypothetical protein BDR04DRAFT_1087011 [Suillus decipiens]|nr:hypothetical protein BDR04DRAFT_1087011 [Suillus decipiens]